MGRLAAATARNEHHTGTQRAQRDWDAISRSLLSEFWVAQATRAGCGHRTGSSLSEQPAHRTLLTALSRNF